MSEPGGGAELFASKLFAAARAWMIDDPDPDTRAELEQLLHDENVAELQARFAGRLAFGTAGLRGPVGAGPTRMNSKVVAQTAAGFAAFLLRRAGTGRSAGLGAGAASARLSVVVACDARTKSTQFAHDAASVLAGAGLDVRLLTAPFNGGSLPTPVLAFAVRHLGASAGVMITASHNPPADNGFKVYLGDGDAGSQIASPVDAEIAALIEQAATGPLDAIARSDSYLRDGADVIEAYVSATVASLGAAAQPSRRFTVAYTAMHGVGYELTKRVFAAAGLPEMVSVVSQQEPDALFPSVAYPNPEEPGALDLAQSLATETDAHLIIAHDPDADRLAVALPARVPDAHGQRPEQRHNEEECGSDVCPCAQVPSVGGAYTQLSGNQVGLLLGWECAERWANRRKQRSGSTTEPVPRGALAATVVSSPALAAVAHAYDLDFVQTLSGFKWVSRVPNLIFGFEEALGYLVNPDVVRDKDGISAAMMLTQLAQRLHEHGETLWDRLDAASERFGHFASDQITIRMGDAAAVEALSARIRSAPPQQFGDVRVEQFTDYLLNGEMPVPANVMRFDLSDGSRVMIRPSGTEPKLKMYLDAFNDEGSVSQRRTAAEQTVADLRRASEALIAEISA